MKKLILLTLQLVSYVSSYSLYGSDLCEKPASISGARSYTEPNEEVTPSEIHYLQAGGQHLFNSNFEAAKDSFEGAIEVNGSPLGYLYRGALENNHPQTRFRYLYIANKAAEKGEISRKLFYQHMIFLTDNNFMSTDEWNIIPISKSKK